MKQLLEKEFNARKLAHVFTILKAKLIDYYQTLEQTEVNFMDFLRDDTPEKKAQQMVEYLYNNCRKDFWQLYEVAYNELATRGEF